MNEKEKFEDIIESKFSEAEFPFDEGNWDGAEEMISSFRKKEKVKRFGLIFLSGIVIGVLIMFPFVNKMGDKSETPAIALYNNKPTESHELPMASVQNKGLAQSAELAVSQKNNEELSATTTTNNENPVIVKSSGKVKNKRNRKNNNVQLGSVIPNGLGTSIKHGKNSQHQPDATSSDSENSLGATSNTNNLNNPTLVNDKLVLFSKLNPTQITTMDSVAFVEHLLDPEKLITDNKPGFIPTWNYSAALGANSVSHFSVNPYQGLEVSRTITPKVEIGTGAYYTYLTVLSGGVKAITTHTTYDFGYQSDITEIKTNKLHYIVIPVYAKYNLNGKNTFMAGTNIYTLFTSSNSLTTYKESYGEKQGVASKKTSGYSNGINNFDIGLFAGYKRNLFGNFGAAIYFNYGLKDIKKNDYYDENKFERNISGQFMVTYKL